VKNIRLFAFICCHLLIFVCIMYLLAATPALAQTLSLSIWPPLLEVIIQPGRTITQAYQITNNSDHELSITPNIFPFEPVGEEGQIKINKFDSNEIKSKIKNQKSKLDFFSFESGERFNQSFLLPVGQTKQLVLKISIPKETPEKDYYYTLLFSTASQDLTKGGQSETSSVTQIGTNILLTISRTGKPLLLGRILEFRSPTIIDSFSSVNFTVRLENWGKTFWKPFGQIKIKGILKQKGEVKLLEQNILANSSRQLTVPSFKPALPIGPFKAFLEFSLNESPPGGGPADSAAGQEQKLSSETTFWYLPYKLTGLILGLFMLYFLLRKISRLVPD